MPKIADSLISNIDVSNLRPQAHVPQPIDVIAKSKRSVFLRAPVPPIGNISVDNLDQFNLEGVVPQFRVFVKNG